MKSVNNKILVKVDLSQKDYFDVGGATVRSATEFDKNYRNRSPVVGQFAESNKIFKQGDFALFHHNHFYQPSPYFVQDDLFSVPMTPAIFGVLNSQGEMIPVMGNMTVKLIKIPTLMDVPDDQQETYQNRYEIINPGWTTYKAGDIIFTRPLAGYEIVFTWNNIEKRVIKVPDSQVCGILKK